MDTKEQPRSGTTGAEVAQIEDGGPAFPRPATEHDEGWTGMTLRDYFAAKALQAMLQPLMAAQGDLDLQKVPGVAAGAYRMADAMLAARKTGGAA